jgi:hypothetical protein
VASSRRPSWTSFLDRLDGELTVVEEGIQDLLDKSTIRYVNPNTPDSSVVFVGAADWGWGPSDDVQDRLRMALLSQYDDWFVMFRMLYRNSTPEIVKKIESADKFVRGWINRDTGISDWSIPSSIDEAKEKVTTELSAFHRLLDLLRTDPDSRVLLVPDTNALLTAPDLAQYADSVGSTTFEAWLVPTVLRELDDLKNQGRTPELRGKAQGVIRRIKGLRDKGALHLGVPLTKSITVFALAREPDLSTSLDWLDPNNSDDRLLGSALDLQVQHPQSCVLLATGDINLQTKADVARLPFVEAPTVG